MTVPVVRLHPLAAGAMTSPYGGFLEGMTGDITYPVPVYLIEHGDSLVVVDSGLHPGLADDDSRLGPLAGIFTTELAADGSGSVGPQLQSAGFDPAQVDTVILTHLHFDHTGGLCQLPNARVVMQRREWADRRDETLVSRGAYNPDDVELGHDLQQVDGDHDLFGDGTVTLLLTDGHTAGHQSVRVKTESQTYTICGDCCYLRRTLTDEHLPPTGHDRERQLLAVRRMAAEQAAGATLLFGHDPEQWADIQVGGLRPTV